MLKLLNMFYNLIQRIASDTGLDATQQRGVISGFVNAAAKEMHTRLECNKAYRVVTLVVPTDKVISLPYYIGELRGVKQHTNELMAKVTNIGQPRFTKSTREYMVNSWTELGESPLSSNISEIGPLSLVSNTTDDVDVLINGQTVNSSAFEESVNMITGTGITTNLYGPQINNIACFSPRTSDILIYDAANVLVSTLYASQTSAKFKIIDVSRWAFASYESETGNLMDVLYKLPFTPLVNDSDSFLAGDTYDDVLYHYAMYLFYLPQNGKENDAAIAKAQAFQSLIACKTEDEAAVVKKLNFGKCKFYGLGNKFSFRGSSSLSVADTWRTNYTY